MRRVHHALLFRGLPAAGGLALLLSLVDCRARGEGGAAAQGTIDKGKHAIAWAVEGTPAPQVEAALAITFTPKGGYKINTAFPFKTTVTCDENIVPKKTKLTKADAAEFSKERIVLRVPFTPQKAGSFVIKVKAELGVCKAEKCKVVKETWDAAVSVQ